MEHKEQIVSEDVKRRNRVIVVLTMLVLFLSYLAFKTNYRVDVSPLIESQLKQLKIENDSLLKNIDSKSVIVGNLERKYDSLEALKRKIKIIYQKEDAKIENLSAIGVINQLDSIFSIGQ